MSLTGRGKPEICPVPVAACADGALLALRALAPEAESLEELSGSQLLAERAALMGLQRSGRVAPGGSCRLLDTADGCLAINLARDDDWAMLPAWLETDFVPNDWDMLKSLLETRSASELVERGRLMGLAVAAEALPQAPASWYAVEAEGHRAVPKPQPLVLDLSSLWAGPLCAHLLKKLGARVIKVESDSRPDGARKGDRAFYDLLNIGKESVSLDLQSGKGRAQLEGLIRQADIVIESARPRGLRQMGIVAEDLVSECPGLTWVGITGYGRAHGKEDWAGFGDDVGVAAGLSALMDAVTGEPMFVGDAIADPLAGMHAALAAWHSHSQGGGRLLSVSLHDVTAHCVSFDRPKSVAALRERYHDWAAMISDADIRPPQSRDNSQVARPLGADNVAITKESV